MKKLFQIKTPTGGVYSGSHGPVFFDDKMNAKIIRDKLGAGYAVTYGPDHKLYQYFQKGV